MASASRSSLARPWSSRVVSSIRQHTAPKERKDHKLNYAVASSIYTEHKHLNFEMDE